MSVQKRGGVGGGGGGDRQVPSTATESPILGDASGERDYKMSGIQVSVQERGGGG